MRPDIVDIVMVASYRIYYCTGRDCHRCFLTAEAIGAFETTPFPSWSCSQNIYAGSKQRNPSLDTTMSKRGRFIH